MRPACRYGWTELPSNSCLRTEGLELKCDHSSDCQLAPASYAPNKEMVCAVISSSRFTGGTWPKVFVTISTTDDQHISGAVSARCKGCSRSGWSTTGAFLVGAVLCSFFWNLNSGKKAHMPSMSMKGGCSRRTISQRSRAGGNCWQR